MFHQCCSWTVLQKHCDQQWLFPVLILFCTLNYLKDAQRIQQKDHSAIVVFPCSQYNVLKIWILLMLYSTTCIMTCIIIIIIIIIIISFSSTFAIHWFPPLFPKNVHHPSRRNNPTNQGNMSDLYNLDGHRPFVYQVGSSKSPSWRRLAEECHFSCHEEWSLFREAVWWRCCGDVEHVADCPSWFVSFVLFFFVFFGGEQK